jgi:hypothetical protein
MAFRLPTFNLTCNIWRASAGQPPSGAPVVTVQCQLRPTRRSIYRTVSAGPFQLVEEILMPKLTDVRSLAGAGSSDTIECPAGSGRFYGVLGVDDVAKGFPNEYRWALVVQAGYAGGWPYPTP